MNETFSYEDAIAYLKNHFKMVLSINDPVSCPNTSLMHYAIGSGTPLKIFMGTKASFEKYSLLKKDARVSCLIVECAEDPLRALSIHGTAHEIQTKVEHELAHSLFKMVNKTKWYVEESEDLTMFVIKPTSMKMLDGSSGELIVTNIDLPQSTREFE